MTTGLIPSVLRSNTPFDTNCHPPKTETANVNKICKFDKKFQIKEPKYIIDINMFNMYLIV